MSASFLFYDLETFGADPRRTRIAQFAAIRTDEALEELAEELAASEAFETAGWQAGEVYSLLVAMQDLATLASSDELLFFAWVRER